jgi:hypothetical protein
MKLNLFSLSRSSKTVFSFCDKNTCKNFEVFKPYEDDPFISIFIEVNGGGAANLSEGTF